MEWYDLYVHEDGEFKSGRTGLIGYVHIVGYKAEGVSSVFDNFYLGSGAPTTPQKAKH